jgi:hypothetical protein
MKRILLTLAILALVTTAASAQSRKLNRTKTKPDSATMERQPDGTIRDVRDDKNNGGTTTPTRVPTTVDPNNPNNNTNGTTPTTPPGTVTPPAGTTRPGNPGSMNR